MKRHIIIEGPDGAGKTTLARQLAFLTGRKYHHEGPPPKGDVFQHYLGLLRTAEPTVFDRLYLGETIYGPLLRGHSEISEADLDYLQGIEQLFSRFILCLPNKETCFRNWLSRAINGQELIRQEEVFNRTYDAWAKLGPRANVVYDYTAKESR